MSYKATVSHSTSERLRIQIAGRKRDAAFFEKLEADLSRCPEVEAIRSNSLTGSVLIFHDGHAQEILHFANKAGIFEATLDPPSKPSILPPDPSGNASAPSVTVRIHKRAARLDHTIGQLSRGRVNLTGATALSLIGLSIFQLFRHSFLPDGGTLLWYAARLLSEDHPPHS